MDKRKLIVISVCVAVTLVAVLALSAGGIFILKGNNTVDSEINSSQTSVGTTAKPVNAVPQTTEPQPEELSALLEKAGYDYDELENIRQLITVTGEDDEYYLQCYHCNNGVWQRVGIEAEAFVGKNGTISPDKKTEGDYYSPQGLYTFGFAFGKNQNPGTRMEYRDVYEGIYWVDDVDSQFYNMWVDGNEKKTEWDSAEKMWSYDEYIYGAVINYNTDPIVKNKGSAIFLHVGEKYTAGCVASDEKTIVEILKWLEPESNPAILIY